MSWSNPRTWVSGALVTAGGSAGLNTNLRDQLLALPANVLSKSGNYTIVAPDDFIAGSVIVKVDTTGGGVTITLPASATAGAGKQITEILSAAPFTNGKSNTCIIDGNASETINGLANTTLFLKHDYVELVSDGSNWIVTNEHTSVLASYYNDADIEFADNVFEQLLYNDATIMDSASACSSGNFTVPVGFGGVYKFLVTMRWEGVADPGDTFYLTFYKNGSYADDWAASYVTWMDDGGRPSGYAITQADLSAGDVISGWGKANIADTEVDVDAGPALGCFHAQLIKRFWT